MSLDKKKIFIFLKNPIDAFSDSQQIKSLLQSEIEWADCEIIQSKEELIRRIFEPWMVITWVFKKKWYPLAPQLKYVLTPAAGKEWVEADPDNRVIIHYGTFHGQIMVESLLGMMFFFNRNYSILLKNQINHIWDRNIQSSTARLSGQNILLVGYGSIGKTIAKVLSRFRCSIRGLQRTFRNSIDEQTGTLYITLDEFEESLGWADHVISLLPSEHSTNNFFTLNHFSLMKKSAFFYVFGRGNCYTEECLIEAIDRKMIAGAGLDVFPNEPLCKSSKLWDTENVFISPHSSCISKDYLYLYFVEIKKLIQNLN